MSAIVKYRPYALRIPSGEAKDLAKAQRLSGQSVNQLIVQCIRRGLPAIIAESQSAGRVTNIEPLKPAEWRRIYSRKDEFEKISAEQLSAFQSRDVPT
jgi:hypothetical protein